MLELVDSAPAFAVETVFVTAVYLISLITARTSR